MTPYDFTSTANPFTCEEDWLGDGICDDDTNVLKCGFDGGDCCLNEIIATNCDKCICHDDEKRHQPTTTTELSPTKCPLFFVMTSATYPFDSTYFSELPSCQEKFNFTQKIDLEIDVMNGIKGAYFYQIQSPDSLVMLTGRANMYQIKFMDNDITWQDFPQAQDQQPFTPRLTATASSKNGRYFLMEYSDVQEYCETFIYTNEKWEKGPIYPDPIVRSCATFLLDSEDVIYIFGGLRFQGVSDALGHVTKYIISQGTFNRLNDLPLTLHSHDCTANVDKDGENVRLLYTVCSMSLIRVIFFFSCSL